MVMIMTTKEMITMTVMKITHQHFKHERESLLRTLGGHVIAVRAGQGVSQLGEQEVVGGGERPAADRVMQVLHHSPGDGQSIEHRCATP